MHRVEVSARSTSRLLIAYFSVMHAWIADPLNHHVLGDFQETSIIRSTHSVHKQAMVVISRQPQAGRAH
jgi:hypothetical protein